MSLIIEKYFLSEESLKKELVNSPDNGIRYSLEKSKVKGDIQEAYGRFSILNDGFETLLDVSGNVQGFDGIFVKGKRVFFYESKLIARGYSFGLNEAEETINNYKKNKQLSKVRFSQLTNTKGSMKMPKLKSEIDLIDGYLLRQKSKISLEIPNERQLIILGSDKKISKISKTTRKKFIDKGRVELIEYEEI